VTKKYDVDAHRQTTMCLKMFTIFTVVIIRSTPTMLQVREEIGLSKV